MDTLDTFRLSKIAIGKPQVVVVKCHQNDGLFSTMSGLWHACQGSCWIKLDPRFDNPKTTEKAHRIWNTKSVGWKVKT